MVTTEFQNFPEKTKTAKSFFVLSKGTTPSRYVENYSVLQTKKK